MKYTAFIIALFLSPAAFSASYDEYEPEALIKYRQDVMHAIRGHNNAIKSIIDNKVPYSDQLDMHMAALKDLFSRINLLFPEGSDFGETEAKDEIWDNPKRFRETADKAREALVKLENTLRNGNAADAKKAVRQFGKASCGNCHKLFKKKDEDEKEHH